MKDFKPVPGYEDHYAISSTGVLMRTARGPGTWPGRIIKDRDNRGYRRTMLSKNDVRKYFAVHRLVWMAHVGPIPDDMQINHKNGIKDDNRLANLEVVTASENAKHAYRVLGLPGQKNPNPGSKNGRAKLKESDIPKIFELRGDGLSQQAIGDLFGVSQTNISLILRKSGWKHLTNQ